MPQPRPVPQSGKALGLVTLTALVVGNMVGSGVFLLPASLAPFGGASLLGWLVSAAGSVLLGLVLARLARRLPAAGGPYAYTREAFGDFTGFLMGWGYWISNWTAVATIAIAMVGYLGTFFPGLAADPARASGTALAAIALLTAINVAGVRQAALVQLVLTLLKLCPLLAIAAFGFTRFEAANLEPFNPTGRPLWVAVYGCLALTLWAFLGLESATVPAGEVRDARRTIPRATVLGIAIATVLYVASTTAVMGMVPREVLAESTAPFATAAALLWGPRWEALVAAGAVVSCLGALNGWILVSGQVPLAIARDGLFPAFFGRVTRRGSPALGLALSGALACLLVVAASTPSLVETFNRMLLLSTLSALVPLVLCTLAEPMLALRARQVEPAGPALARGTVGVAALAFVYSVLAVASSGHETVFWGFLSLLAGIPFYVLARWRLAAPGR